MVKQFILHEQLAKETFHLVNWPLCEVLLMNDANYPWLILVPRVLAVYELYQLDLAQQQQLLVEINAASKALLCCQADKLNVAALGNVVSQLHVHIIARFKNDAAWPKPIWGVVPAKPYEQLPAIITRYRSWLSEQKV